MNYWKILSLWVAVFLSPIVFNDYLPNGVGWFFTASTMSCLFIALLLEIEYSRLVVSLVWCELCAMIVIFLGAMEYVGEGGFFYDNYDTLISYINACELIILLIGFYGRTEMANEYRDTIFDRSSNSDGGIQTL